MPQGENIITQIKNQRKSLIEQSPINGGIITLQEAVSQVANKEEHLSTVEDKQSETCNEVASRSFVSSDTDQQDLKLEIEDLEKQNQILKKENEAIKNELQSISEQFNLERETFHRRESQILTDLQKSRRESLFSKPNVITESAMKHLQSEVTRLESMMRMVETQFNEERCFWNKELKDVEQKAVEAKLKYAQIMTEKDALELKLKQVQLGRERGQTPGHANKQNKSFFEFLFCND